MPAKAVVVVLINVRHGCQGQVGSGGQTCQSSHRRVCSQWLSLPRFIFHLPTKCPELGVQPVGGMCSNAVRVGAGELTLLMSDPKGSLVGSANGLAWHPNPCGFAILQDLKELRVPCGSASCSISPLGAWFLVDDMVTHLPGWDSWDECHHSTS